MNENNYSLPAEAILERPAEGETHGPLACPVCGESLDFVGYARKMGKNGKEAKWPVYVRCSKQKHEKTKKQKDDIFGFHPVVEEPIRIVEGRSGPKGILYQLDKMSKAAASQAVGEFSRKYGEVGLVKEARVHSSDYAQVQVQATGDNGLVVIRESLAFGNQEIPLVRDDRLSPGHRYLFLVFEPSK